MLNVIFTANKNAIKELSDNEEAKKTVLSAQRQWVTEVTECRTVNKTVVIHVDVVDIEDYYRVKEALEERANVKALGIWQRNGLQYGYEYAAEGIVQSVDEYGEVIESPAPFKLTSYMKALADKVTRDAKGKKISSSRRTEPVQINLWAGQADRDLTDYKKIK